MEGTHQQENAKESKGFEDGGGGAGDAVELTKAMQEKRKSPPLLVGFRRGVCLMDRILLQRLLVVGLVCPLRALIDFHVWLSEEKERLAKMEMRGGESKAFGDEIIREMEKKRKAAEIVRLEKEKRKNAAAADADSDDSDEMEEVTLPFLRARCCML